MIVNPAFVRNWFGQRWLSRNRRAVAPAQPRPSLSALAQTPTQLPHFVAECRVAGKYLTLEGPLDWANFPARNPQRAWPRPKPLARAPFVAAYLVKLHEGKTYMSELRQYLVEHPALVWLLGFPLVASPDYSWGFDVEASVPTPRQFLMLDFTLLDDSAFIAFVKSSEYATYLILRRYVWRGALKECIFSICRASMTGTICWSVRSVTTRSPNA